MSEQPANSFETEAAKPQTGTVRACFSFLRNNKKWWITPIVVLLLLLSALILLGGSGVAPFIYTLF